MFDNKTFIGSNINEFITEVNEVKPKSLSTQNHIMYLVYTYQTESKLFVKLSTIVENAII